MGYKINPAEFSSAFFVPSSVVDRHIKLAGATQLKILLSALKDCASGIDEAKISRNLSIPLPDVIDALNFWCELGILSKSDEEIISTVVEVKAPQEKPHKKIIRREIIKPTREQINVLGQEDPNIVFLLREAQMKLGRPLKQNESSTIVWLYDENGLDTSIILMLISFAVTENKATVAFIEKTAVDWLNDGVTTVSQAEAKINAYYEAKTAWSRICRIMGLDYRMPSKKESTLAKLWLNEYQFSEDMIKLAYDRCVDSISKPSFDYIKKILDSWHKDSITTVEQVEALDNAKQQTKTSADNITKYDLDEFTKSLNENLPE